MNYDAYENNDKAVIPYTKLRRNSRMLGFTHRDIDAFLDNMCKLSSFQIIHYLWRPFLPDPKDDHVLELLLDILPLSPYI